MYPDSGYKRAHAQSVCTRPFSRAGRGLGTRLCMQYTVHACMQYMHDTVYGYGQDKVQFLILEMALFRRILPAVKHIQSARSLIIDH